VVVPVVVVVVDDVVVSSPFGGFVWPLVPTRTVCVSPRYDEYHVVRERTLPFGA